MGKFFSMRYVPHSVFEALRRFPDHELLIDGTLRRVEPSGYEFRIIDETADRRFPLGVMTTALQKELHDYYRRSWQERAAEQNVNPDQALDLDAEPLDIFVTPVADERSQPEPPTLT
jgi:hypothetical protein